MVAPQPKYPLHDNKVTAHKPHLLCRLFGHNYQSVAYIHNTEKSITGYSMCKRCGYQEGTTTFGPFNIKM